jgi:signal transduction histidine kinase
MQTTAGSNLWVLSQLWPPISPSDSDFLRKRRLAIRGGHLAFVLLVIVAIADSLIRGARVLSSAASASLVLAGLIFLVVSLWASASSLRATQGSAPRQSSPRRHAWKVGLYLVVQFALAALIFHLASPARPMAILWLILLLPISHSVFLFSRWGIGLVCVVCAILFTGYLFWSGQKAILKAEFSFLFAAAFTVFVTQFAVSGEAARTEVERMAAELSEANRKLRQYAVQAEELATVRERNRLAREIHDSLGHYLTVVNVQIEAARAMLDCDRTRALAALGRAQSLTQEGLQDIRRSVSALRASPLDRQPLAEALRTVAAEGQASGLATEVQILGVARTLPPPAELTLYRAGQEGITNVRKHAQAHRICMVLDYRETERVKLGVSDDGAGAQDHAGGFGLLGLRERVQLLGGTVRVETSPGQGFRLEVEVPG